MPSGAASLPAAAVSVTRTNANIDGHARKESIRNMPGHKLSRGNLLAMPARKESSYARKDGPRASVLGSARDEAPPVAGYLKNLHGHLSMYNERLVRPKRLTPLPGRCDAALPIRDAATEVPQYLADMGSFSLVVGPNNFEPVLDRDHASKPDQFMKELQVKKSTSGNNRSSTKVSMLTLGTQIRQHCRKQGVLLETFKILDRDGSGEIDKTEMKIGLHRLGFEVSCSDVDLAWPMFDLDGNGTIELDEFFAFMLEDIASTHTRVLYKDKPTLGSRYDRRIQTDRIMQKNTSIERKKRIVQKTRIAALVRCTRERLSSIWEGKDVRVEASRLFTKIDVTGDNNIDKTEFYNALELLAFHEYTDIELQLLWQMIDEDDSGEIDRNEFIDFFLNITTAGGGLHVSDRLRMPSISENHSPPR